jgi:hypothetical protein
MEYKVGDKVVITYNTSQHNFKIGDVVEIVGANILEKYNRQSLRGRAWNRFSYVWSFTPHECRPYIQTNKEMARLLDKEY